MTGLLCLFISSTLSPSYVPGTFLGPGGTAMNKMKSLPPLGSHIVVSKSENIPCSSNGKEYACNAGDPGSIPGSGRSPGVGSGDPLQYACLENSMNRRAWWATVHGVAKSQTRLTHTLLGKQYDFVTKYFCGSSRKVILFSSKCSHLFMMSTDC